MGPDWDIQLKLNRGVIVVISKATKSMLALYKACSLRPCEYETANSGQSNRQQDTESFFQASLGFDIVANLPSRYKRLDVVTHLGELCNLLSGGGPGIRLQLS
jgi:hypothetical protein